MFQTLDVAIGLILVMTLVSLICSILNEWISGILSKRGQMLWEGIYHLIGRGLGDQICGHHLLQGLVRESWFDRVPILKRLDRSKPSYVPTQTFVLTLMDALGSASGTGFPATVDDLKRAIESLPQAADPRLQAEQAKIRQALLALVDDAQGNLEKAKKNLGDWFDAGMNRVSGWYKRWSQLWLLGLGLVVSFAIGVDSLYIGRQLWADPALRAATAQAATAFVEEHREGLATAGPGEAAATPAAGEEADPLARMEELQGRLVEINVPLTPFARDAVTRQYNDRAGRPADAPVSFWSRLRFWLGQHWLGFLMTGFGASLGAPFWFDLLNKFVTLRASGRKPEEERKS